MTILWLNFGHSLQRIYDNLICNKLCHFCDFDILSQLVTNLLLRLMVTKIVTILTRKLNCDHFIVTFYNLSHIGHNRKFVTKKRYIVTNIVVAIFIFSCS